jgi:hypothetical protein
MSFTINEAFDLMGLIIPDENFGDTAAGFACVSENNPDLAGFHGVESDLVELPAYGFFRKLFGREHFFPF